MRRDNSTSWAAGKAKNITYYLGNKEPACQGAPARSAAGGADIMHRAAGARITGCCGIPTVFSSCCHISIQPGSDFRVSCFLSIVSTFRENSRYFNQITEDFGISIVNKRDV